MLSPKVCHLSEPGGYTIKVRLFAGTVGEDLIY